MNFGLKTIRTSWCFLFSSILVCSICLLSRDVYLAQTQPQPSSAEATVRAIIEQVSDRITTVISGVMYYGVGGQSDLNSIQSYPAGSVVYTPAGTTHYIWAKDGEIVMQETGRGPTGIEFANVSSE